MAKPGRPTKYKKEFCKMLIEHMTEGLSYTSFAGVIGVHFDTLYEWEKVYPEFSEAKKLGQPKSLLFYERFMIAGMKGECEANNTLAVWYGKNVHGWTDKQETTISSGAIKIEITEEDSEL